MTKMAGILAIFCVCLVPVAGLAQTASPPPPSGQNVPPTIPNIVNNPNAFPTPTMPWTGITNPNMGTRGNAVKYIQVPPQQVVVPVYVPGPGSFSGGFEQQVVEIPGYVVTETATGYLYPQRLSIEQVTYGVYRWRVLPPLFTAK